MMLARVDPNSSRVDRRTFECKCGHMELMLMKYEQSSLSRQAYDVESGVQPTTISVPTKPADLP
jgi:hypothetical protein